MEIVGDRDDSGPQPFQPAKTGRDDEPSFRTNPQQPSDDGTEHGAGTEVGNDGHYQNYDGGGKTAVGGKSGGDRPMFDYEGADDFDRHDSGTRPMMIAHEGKDDDTTSVGSRDSIGSDSTGSDSTGVEYYDEEDTDDPVDVDESLQPPVASLRQSVMQPDSGGDDDDPFASLAGGGDGEKGVGAAHTPLLMMPEPAPHSEWDDADTSVGDDGDASSAGDYEDYGRRDSPEDQHRAVAVAGVEAVSPLDDVQTDEDRSVEEEYGPGEAGAPLDDMQYEDDTQPQAVAIAEGLEGMLDDMDTHDAGAVYLTDKEALRIFQAKKGDMEPGGSIPHPSSFIELDHNGALPAPDEGDEDDFVSRYAPQAASMWDSSGTSVGVDGETNSRFRPSGPKMDTSDEELIALDHSFREEKAEGEGGVKYKVPDQEIAREVWQRHNRTHPPSKPSGAVAPVLLSAGGGDSKDDDIDGDHDVEKGDLKKAGSPSQRPEIEDYGDGMTVEGGWDAVTGEHQVESRRQELEEKTSFLNFPDKRKNSWFKQNPNKCRLVICAAIMLLLGGLCGFLWQKTSNIKGLPTVLSSNLNLDPNVTITEDEKDPDPGLPPKEIEFVPAAPFDISKLCSAKSLLDNPVAGMLKCAKACSPAQCCYGSNFNHGIQDCFTGWEGHNSEACRGYTPYCDSLYGSMGPLPLAPTGVWDACDPSRVHTSTKDNSTGDFGREICEDLCQDAYCCFPSAFLGAKIIAGADSLETIDFPVEAESFIQIYASDASCFAENVQSCGGYGPCLALTLGAGDLLLEENPVGPIHPPDSLPLLCDSGNILTEEGMVRCATACLLGSCCHSSDSTLSCATEHRDICTLYEPCREFRVSFEATATPTVAPAGGEDSFGKGDSTGVKVPPPPPPNLGGACSYQNLSNETTRALCEEMCLPGACCYIDGSCRPKDASLPSTDVGVFAPAIGGGLQMHVCDMYDPCLRLLPLLDPPADLSDLCTEKEEDRDGGIWKGGERGLLAKWMQEEKLPPIDGPATSSGPPTIAAPVSFQEDVPLGDDGPTPLADSANLRGNDNDGVAASVSASLRALTNCVDACRPALCCFAPSGGPDDCSGLHSGGEERGYDDGGDHCEQYSPCAFLLGDHQEEETEDGDREDGAIDPNFNNNTPANVTTDPNLTSLEKEDVGGEGHINQFPISNQSEQPFIGFNETESAPVANAEEVLFYGSDVTTLEGNDQENMGQNGQTEEADNPLLKDENTSLNDTIDSNVTSIEEEYTSNRVPGADSWGEEDGNADQASDAMVDNNIPDNATTDLNLTSLEKEDVGGERHSNQFLISNQFEQPSIGFNETESAPIANTEEVLLFGSDATILEGNDQENMGQNGQTEQADIPFFNGDKD